MDKIAESKWYMIIEDNRIYRVHRTAEFGGDLYSLHFNKKMAIRRFKMLSKEAEDFEKSLNL